jgi:hypothetical protein
VLRAPGEAQTGAVWPAIHLGVLVSIGDVRVPASVPVLSRGKHRSPRTGACFMEFASFLAGERWSDHPACTHPLLAALARHVNDCTSEAGRQRLVELVPSVIGLASDDPHVDVRIALRAATTALPVVAADRVMAVAVLTCQRVLADLDGLPEGWLDDDSRQALARAPYAADWARRYTAGITTSVRMFRRHAAPNIVRDAVVGIARACVPEPDRLLHDLLASAIEDCRVWATPRPDHLETIHPSGSIGG